MKPSSLDSATTRWLPSLPTRESAGLRSNGVHFAPRMNVRDWQTSWSDISTRRSTISPGPRRRMLQHVPTLGGDSKQNANVRNVLSAAGAIWVLCQETGSRLVARNTATARSIPPRVK